MGGCLRSLAVLTPPPKDRCSLRSIYVENVMSAHMWGVSLLGVGRLFRLERNAPPMVNNQIIDRSGRALRDVACCYVVLNSSFLSDVSLWVL